MAFLFIMEDPIHIYGIIIKGFSNYNRTVSNFPILEMYRHILFYLFKNTKII